MKNYRKKRRILAIQSFGFLALIAIAWGDAWLDLSNRVFGGDVHSGWQESLIRTVGILSVWGVVYLTTKHLLHQLYYVERFVRVCASCRKVGDSRGDWVSIEEHFARQHSLDASHGFCPECQENRNLSAEVEAWKRAGY